MAYGVLKAPKNLVINLQPSPKQYELWKLLQPDYCPHCGGQIEQVLIGYDAKGNAQYKPQCNKCQSQDLPQLILGGGAAGGGKSYLGSCWIISSCIRFENIRAVVARKTIKSLKESTFNTIKTILKTWGPKEGINYKINNLEGTVTFWNDSVILLKEMVDLPSDPNFERFGSSEYTIAFVDEVSEISERAIEVLFSRLRWRTHETFKTPRMFMSTNPCITWVRSRFVQDDEGNPIVCKEGEAYVPFSIFDNPDIKFRQTYEASLNKIRDRATRERLLYGNWDFVDTNIMAAYSSFDGEKHLVSNLKEKVYNPLKPIVSSWDFNVSPFMSTLSLQIDYDKKKIYVLEEILGKPENKDNNTPKLSQKVKDKYLTEKHTGGLLITDGTVKVDLRKMVISDLSPIYNMSLQELNLLQVQFSDVSVLDNYLVNIVENYGSRRDCTVYLDTEPTEVGMAAIQTIINEPAWNESGKWKFVINDIVYTKES